MLHDIDVPSQLHCFEFVCLAAIVVKVAGSSALSLLPQNILRAILAAVVRLQRFNLRRWGHVDFSAGIGAFPIN